MNILQCFVIATMVLLTTTSCRRINKYSDIDAPIAREQLIDIMSDLLIAKVMTREEKVTPDAFETEYAKVMAIHKVTPKDYEESIDAYLHNHTDSKVFIEDVIALLQQKNTLYTQKDRLKYVIETISEEELYQD